MTSAEKVWQKAATWESETFEKAPSQEAYLKKVDKKLTSLKKKQTAEEGKGSPSKRAKIAPGKLEDQLLQHSSGGGAGGGNGGGDGGIASILGEAIALGFLTTNDTATTTTTTTTSSSSSSSSSSSLTI
jgi:hypothetical protein